MAFHEIYKENEFIPAKIILHEGTPTNCFVIDHWHDELEIIYSKDSKMAIYVDGKLWELSGDDFVLINSRSSHSIHVQGVSNCHHSYALSVTISWDYMKQMNPDIDDWYFIPEAFPEKAEAIKDIMRALYVIYDGKPQPFYYLKVNSLICQLMFVLFTEFARKRNVSESINSQKYFQRVSQILRYMKENYAEDLSVEQVAELFGMSREHLSRIFKKYVGKSFREHLALIRMERAHVDLVNTDYTILQIAVNHGFPDARAYTHIFRQVYGMSPSQYRKSIKI